MATAKAMPQRLASEAARGALLAAHAATGLSGGVSPQATRLLRAAEGILRSAIAVLAVPPVLDVAQSVVAPLAPPRRRRPRRKRSGKGIGKDDVDGDAGMGVELQGSVGVGDGAGASSAVLSVAAVGVGTASSGAVAAAAGVGAPVPVGSPGGGAGYGPPWARGARVLFSLGGQESSGVVDTVGTSFAMVRAPGHKKAVAVPLDDLKEAPTEAGPDCHLDGRPGPVATRRKLRGCG
jgi:hypothetical protein